MIQTAGMNLEMHRQEDQIEEDMIFCTEPMRINLAFDGMTKRDNTLELQLRYETSYSRMHDRAMKSLQRLRESAQPKEPLQTAVPEAAGSTPEPALAAAVDPVVPTISISPEPQEQELRN